MDCSTVLQLVRLQARAFLVTPGNSRMGLSGSMTSWVMQRKRRSLPAFERLRKTFPNGRDWAEYGGGLNVGDGMARRKMRESRKGLKRLT
jgi:hypothetical protein